MILRRSGQTSVRRFANGRAAAAHVQQEMMMASFIFVAPVAIRRQRSEDFSVPSDHSLWLKDC